MSQIAELIATAEQQGVQFLVDGEKLRLKVPKGALNTELKTALSEHKADIIAFLQDETSVIIDEHRFPLSYGQQALWFVYQEAPDSPAYNMVSALRMTDGVDSIVLQRALHAVVKRHAQLRTHVEFDTEGKVWQQVTDTLTELDIIDASQWTWEHLLEQAHKYSQQPFDLTQSGLRAALFQQASDSYLLVFVLHHLFGDARSMGIIQQEWLALYAAEIQGQATHLPALPVTYANYVHDEAKQLNSPQGQQLAEYWHQQLAGEVSRLNLPTDHPRPHAQTFNGASYHFQLSPTLSTQLTALAQNQKTSLFTLLLGAFQVLLHRYTGQPDIWVGTPTSAGRLHNEFSQLVGYFVNPVVLRSQFTEQSLSFQQLLTQLHPQVIAAQAHQAYPFPLLVQQLQPQRDTGASPLFQVMFSWQKKYEIESEVASACLSYMHQELPQMEGQFELTLTMAESTAFGCILNYKADLFDASRIERMAQHLTLLLEGIVEQPEQSISQLPMLTEKETKQLLAWNDTATDYPKDQTIVDLFEQIVTKTPSNTAVVFEEQQLTYQQLNEKVNQLAHYLLGIKTQAGTVLLANNPLIAIGVERSFSMVIGLLGILKAGGAYVPIDPSYPPARIRYMLDDSATPLLLTQTHLKAQLSLDELEHDCVVVCLDEADFVEQPTENPLVNCTAADLAYVIYTSGSTGKPKGAMNTHTGIVNRLLWMQETYQITYQDRILQKTPFSFDVSVWEFFWPLLTGAGLVVAKPEGHKDPAYLASVIARYEVTVLHFVPSMLQTFLSHADVNNCHSLKRVICSGEALGFELAQQFFANFADLNIELHNLYGPTEAAVDVSHWSCQNEKTYSLIPIGKPVANTRLYVLDVNHQIMPINVPGELCIAGIQVGRGYLNRPELTAEKFIEVELFGKTERIYKTGDLARWLPDGNLEYLGRIDNQIKLRGFRIELGEIEAVLHQHPDIKEAVVILYESDDNKRLVAYLTTDFASKDDLVAELKDWLKARLQDYMIPSHFTVLDKLPLTPNGKIDRRALPEPVIRKSIHTPPRDAVELRLVQLWGKLFGISPVSVLDDFFEIGGDSLLAIRLFANIKQEFGITVPLHTIFQNRTVEQLACILRQDSIASTWHPLVCLQSQGSNSPLFFVHASGGSAFNYLEIATFMGTERPFYAIQPRGIEPGESFHDSIEEMAADYVDAVRRTQSKGPYLFAGWSFGGAVIFEMARILEQAGETVPLLIMIDAPEPLANVYKEDDVEFLLDRVPYYLGATLDDLDLHDSREAQLAYLLKEIKLTGLFRPDIDQAYALHWLNLYKHHNMLVGSYKPAAPVNSKIIFFKPAEKIPFDDLMGKPIPAWERLAHGGIEVHDAPGNHFNMIASVNVPVLVEKMKKSIETHFSE
jgi:amino acid adenylation domain-containing protein